MDYKKEKDLHVRNLYHVTGGIKEGFVVAKDQQEALDNLLYESCDKSTIRSKLSIKFIREVYIKPYKEDEQ